ncbi:sterile alpha motif domain-containing protein 9-like [Lepisosteus oculatus]|uniref:sterile alpha motif domain-containing protein 9-like n=1 Tax=Lepisosteus oculatus TaxID=7918 RepID=UPI0035F516DD
MSSLSDLPDRIEDWSREDVHRWLVGVLNVDSRWADKFYEEEVSGLELVYFQKQDLLDLHIKHGPAVRIINNLEELKKAKQPSQDQKYLEEHEKASQPPQVQKNLKELQNAKEPLQEQKNLEELDKAKQPSQVQKNLGELQNAKQPSQEQKNLEEHQKAKQPSQEQENLEELEKAKQLSQNLKVLQNAKQPSQEQNNLEEHQKAKQPSQNLKELQNAKQPSEKQKNLEELQNAKQPSQEQNNLQKHQKAKRRKAGKQKNQEKLQEVNQLSQDENTKHNTSEKVANQSTQNTSETVNESASANKKCAEEKRNPEGNKTSPGIKADIELSEQKSADLKLKATTNENGNDNKEAKGLLHAQKQSESKAESSPKYPQQKNTCSFYLFDSQHQTKRYIQNYILSPETGPGNRIEPVHEYKLLGNVENASETDILKKFSNEVFRFSAACMNSRTNGTIHFGVGDRPHFHDGEIIGIDVKDRNKYVDILNKSVQNYFGENAEDAKMCIRQPRFVQVLSPDNTLLNKYVIEVDVVPSYSVCKGKEYYINMMLLEDNRWMKSKEIYLFVRDGASSKDLMGNRNQKEMKLELKKFSDSIKGLDLLRKSMESKTSQMKRPSNQGEKLKHLITCGKGTLDNYNEYIIVINKSHPEQLEHLQFLSDLKIFTVLEFDPDSAVNGVCNFYRKSRIANLHSPADFKSTESESTKIVKLNLYKQTSWLFCNGRGDLESETDRPLRPGEWLTQRAKDVQDAILFLCNPDVLQIGRYQVVFLLLSAVESMTDPVLETFLTFYKNLGGAQNILCICESENTFLQWKDFVQTRCDTDITRHCIYELNLSEINGTISKLRPLNETSCRFLPSSGSSSVVFEKKVEDLMTALAVLCENECENTDIEKSEEFKSFRSKIEEDFYRGGKVTWWNFYFSEKPHSLPFIKRDKFEALKNNLTSLASSSTSMCVIQNLFHHPGCGGSTLAMHVLWSLRKEFRCAVLKNKTVPNIEVASQVKHLLMLRKSKGSNYTPVLLLIDDSEGTEDAQDLQKCIRKAIDEVSAEQERPSVILLNCVRSQDPRESCSGSVNESIYISNSLSQREQEFFEMKLGELAENHEKPETFYAFMILKANFSIEYIENVVSNTLKDLDISSKQAQLISFLALLNAYDNDSSISVSFCEDFLGIKNTLRGKVALEDRMAPYSTLLILFRVEEHGTYQAVKILHHMIATQCLEQLTKKYNVKKSEIITNFLHCDLFFKTGMGKDNLAQSVKSILITRQRRTESDDKHTRFSPLIEKMKDEEGTDQISEVLVKAAHRFDKSYAIPQAMARHLYLNKKDFESALHWAKIARTKKESSYIVDTIGQVFKTDLRHKIEFAKTHKKNLTPADLETYLNLAHEATKAFQKAQDLAKTDDVPDFEDLYTKRKRTTYNTSGYIGEVDIAMIVCDILSEVPFFHVNDPMCHIHMLKFLKGSMPLGNIRGIHDELSDRFLEVLKKYEGFLVNLKPRVKQAFEFFENYFVHLKDRNVDREMESRTKKKISESFKKYVSLFCTSDIEKHSERISKPKLSLQQDIEEKKIFLEQHKADCFSGLLHCTDKESAEIMQEITKSYKFIYENSSTKTVRDQTNYILANINLKCKTSAQDKKNKLYIELSKILKSLLQDIGTQHAFPEPYYLALLLFWPEKDSVEDNCKNISTYVMSLNKSFKRQYSHMLSTKSTIAHFYLGKGSGLNRLVHKTKIDQCLGFGEKLNSLWKSGAVWKEKSVQDLLLRVNGTTEQGQVYIQYGSIKIPVRAAYLGGIRSGYSKEKVSFYLGFSIDGPIACDIESKSYS